VGGKVEETIEERICGKDALMKGIVTRRRKVLSKTGTSSAAGVISRE